MLIAAAARVRPGRRPHLHGPRRGADRRADRDRSARRSSPSSSPRCSTRRSTGSRSTSAARDRRRTPRADTTAQAARRVRPRRRPRHRHRRALAGVAVDQRGLPLPVAHQHLAGGPGDGGARGGPRPVRCGAMVGMVLTAQRLPRRAIGAGLVALTVLAIGGAAANGLRYDVPAERDRRVHSHRGARRQRRAPCRPPTCASTRRTSSATTRTGCRCWAGRAACANDRGQFIDHLEKVGPGHYVSTEPMPVSGSWKTLLRVHDGKTFTAVPIFLAGDPGIGAQEVPAEAQFTRPFVSEITILQRERSPDIPQSLWLIGCLVVLVCTLAMIAGITWGGGRINNSEPTGATRNCSPQRRHDGSARRPTARRPPDLACGPGVRPGVRRRRRRGLHRGEGPAQRRRASQ